MKPVVLALIAFTGLGASAANAQSVDVRVHRDRGMHRGWEHNRGYERHREFRTGSIHGCKTIIIKREGMTKRIKKCG